MVKGTSRQVILVHSPDRAMFEQAIFILKDNAPGQGVTEEALLKEAEQALKSAGTSSKRRRPVMFGAFWALSGAAVTGVVWALTALLG